MRKLLLYTLLLIVSSATFGQEKWNLKSVVEYAMSNNISVKQSDLQVKQSELTLKQSKLSQIPDLSLGSNISYNSGNNQDPVTFRRVNQTFISSGYQLQSSAEIFNFFSLRNTIQGNEWELQASKAYVNKVKYDIALAAANAYLQVLLAKEQEKIMEVQVSQTAAQVSNTRKMVSAGTLPELNAIQMEAQLSLDSGNYIAAKGNRIQTVLSLKALLNLDAATPFDIDEVPVEQIPLEQMVDLQPETVYAAAMANQPQQKYNDMRLKAAEKFRSASKGNLYPALSAYGGLSSNYVSANSPNYVPIAGPYEPNGNVVNVGGTDYFVYAPTYSLSQQGTIKSDPYFTQLSDNFRQYIGLSLNIPIFSGYTMRTQYLRSKLNVQSLKLQQEQDNQKLKQDIYQSHNAATTALEKLNASEKSVAAATKTYEFATKRYDVGLLGTFDLVSTQNSLLRAKLEYSMNRYDYVFKMKVLEFYKGMGLKL